MEHTRVSTSPEVWAVIKARHQDLKVFYSYSAPDGNHFGIPEMMTEYGFEGAPIPLIGERSTWEKGDKSYDRVNEVHQYWICVPLNDG